MMLNIVLAAGVKRRILRSPSRVGIVSAGRGPNLSEPCLNLVPNRLVDDPELRHVICNQLQGRLQPGNTAASIRISYKPHPVPDEAPGIEFVPEDSGAASSMPSDRRVAPRASLWARNTVGVESLGDGDGARTGRGHGEDALYDRCFRLID